MCPETSHSKSNSNLYDSNFLSLNDVDPLEGLGDVGSEPKLYRVDRIVYAEPLVINKTKETQEIREETTQLGNVTVWIRNGKRKKLYVKLNDESNLTCPMQTCLKTFPSPPLLKAHIRKIHYSEKTFQCEVCGANFTALYLLRRHSVVHDEKKVQCPVCKKTLSLRTNLLVHLRSHADTRPHACTTCGKRFLRRSTMNAHAAVHEKS